MATFTYPTNAELSLVEQDFLPRLQNDRPIFDILPIENVDADLVMWEQGDNFVGLQQIRGLNGDPPRVKKVGGKRYIVEPGVYGEKSEINEREITQRRRFGTFGSTVDISDLVLIEQQKLLQRRLDRIEYIGWTLLTTGTFSVANATGGVVHTDTFTLQSFTASPLWSVIATATPIADMRTMKLKARGHSVRFDGSSKLYVNQAYINFVLANTNAADLGGKKLNYGQSVLELADVNRIFLMNDLPQLVPMEDGYYDESGVFQLFIPNGVGVLVGSRKSGAPIGTYAMTRNANNPDSSPGPYTKVVDLGETLVPRQIVVHDGHNGSPKLVFPGAIVQLTI